MFQWPQQCQICAQILTYQMVLQLELELRDKVYNMTPTNH